MSNVLLFVFRIHVKSESQNMDGAEQHHVCNVCGEWFEEALALLAHAESHARYYMVLCQIQFYLKIYIISKLSSMFHFHISLKKL